MGDNLTDAPKRPLPGRKSATASRVRVARDEVQVAAITEDAIPAAARHLLHDPDLTERRQRRSDGRRGEGQELGGLGDGDERVRLEQLMHAQSRARHPSQLGDPRPIPGEELSNFGRQIHRLASRLLDSLQEEADPALPVARGPDPLEELVVALAVLLEVEAEVEERLPERTLVAENERDEEAPEPAVAVEERVNGLELDVDQGRLQQRGCLDRVVVNEFLETPQTVDDQLGG